MVSSSFQLQINRCTIVGSMYDIRVTDYAGKKVFQWPPCPKKEINRWRFYHFSPFKLSCIANIQYCIHAKEQIVMMKSKEVIREKSSEIKALKHFFPLLYINEIYNFLSSLENDSSRIIEIIWNRYYNRNLPKIETIDIWVMLIF